MIIFSQISPCSSNLHNFSTVTPIVVKPTLTSSYRPALSFGNIFTRCSQSGNYHFALASNHPPLRVNHPTICSAASPHFFLESPSPQASHNTHLHDSHAVAMVFNLNIYLMFACLNYGYRCFGNASGLVLTFLLCCFVLCDHVIPTSIGFHMFMIASSTC